MDYNTDKILQRQRICRRCKSFVTFERSDEGQLVCPLCSHKLEPSVNRSKMVRLDKVKEIIAKQLKDKYGLEYKLASSSKANSLDADFDVPSSQGAADLDAPLSEEAADLDVPDLDVPDSKMK